MCMMQKNICCILDVCAGYGALVLGMWQWIYSPRQFSMGFTPERQMQDLICHIQNDSFFTSSSRQIEEREKVISLCTTTPFLQSMSCHRAMSRAQGGTGQMLLGNSTPLVGRALQAEHRRGTRGEWDRGTPGCLFVSGPVRNDTTQALVVAVEDRQQSLFCWVGE